MICLELSHNPVPMICLELSHNPFLATVKQKQERSMQIACRGAASIKKNLTCTIGLDARRRNSRTCTPLSVAELQGRRESGATVSGVQVREFRLRASSPIVQVRFFLWM